MERISKLDIAKGIGISLVVYGHTFSPFSHYTHLFQMPLFFILSGYLYNPKDSIKEMLIKKSKSLLFPYFYFLVLTNLIFILLYETLEKPYHIYPSMLIAPYGVSGALWTFIAVYISAVVFKIIDRILTKEGYKAVAVFVLFAVGLLLHYKQIKIPLYFDSACTITIFYATGYWLKKYPLIERLIYVGFIGVVVIYTTLNYTPSVNLKLNVYSDPLCYFVSCGIALLFIRLAGYLEKIPITKKIFSYVGRMAIVILGLHFTLFEFLYLIFPRNNYLAAVIVAVLSIACILLINRLLKVDEFLNKIRKTKLNLSLNGHN